MTGTDLTHDIIGAAIEVHKRLGPGVLESVYEERLTHEFRLRNLRVDRRVPSPLSTKKLNWKAVTGSSFSSRQGSASS